MHHPGAGGGSRPGHGGGTGPLHRVEFLGAGLGQDADQVDGDVRIAHRGLDRGRVAQIGLHGVDLADPAQRLKMEGQFRPPHRNANPVIAPGQRPDHAAPDKTRSSENRDEGVQIRCHGSGFPGQFPGVKALGIATD